MARYAFKAAKTQIFIHGITLAKQVSVKKTITYREITVAIGILVAVVIALTLWISEPRETMTGFESRPRFDLATPANTLLKSTSAILTELRK